MHKETAFKLAHSAIKPKPYKHRADLVEAQDKIAYLEVVLASLGKTSDEDDGEKADATRHVRRINGKALT